METRRFTRSQIPLSERENAVNVVNEEKENRKRKRNVIDRAPFIKYTGKLFYHITFAGCAEVAETLLTEAEKVPDLFVLGFDLEWPFNFQTGPGKVAVIQISPNLDICYVLHVSQLKSLPKSLTDLLIHPKVRLTGINIKNDLCKLSRDFKGVDGDKAVENCLDLGPMANNVSSFSQRWSMAKLVEHFFDMRISKDKAVRMSKWHVIPLSKAQKLYAALDAFASLKLYMLLKEKEVELAKAETGQ